MPDIFTVTLPDIGEGVVEGEVIEWLKDVGDPIKQDEPVVIVMTDKATVELPAPHPGILHKQYYKAGETAIKDKPLYDIALSSQQPKDSETLPSFSEKSETPRQREKANPPPTLTVKDESAQKPLATPATRRVAKELGVDLHQVAPTGKEGRITEEDVRNVHVEGEKLVLAGIPKLMAKKMVLSHQMIPAFSYFEQADATRLIQLKKRVKEEAKSEHIPVTFMPFFIRALSHSMKEYPLVNSSLDSDSQSVHLHHSHNIGIAMATEQGLIVPVLKGVQEMSLQEVIQNFDALIDKALSGRLEPSDMKGATITISNYGSLSSGSLFATPIINYPEVAILAIAKIHKQPVVVNDEIVIREMLNLSWTFDHRIIDGHLAALFSCFFSQLIANPANLL